MSLAKDKACGDNAGMINIVLFNPEIPPNTGNIIRLCSNIGASLHLIEPLGFTLEEKQLKRAGLDYHEYSQVSVYKNFQAFLDACHPPRIIAFSTKGKQRHSAFAFTEEDFLLFGPESRGLPAELLTSPQIHAVLRLPMMAYSRSLNLANTVAIAAFEAWRQFGYAGSLDASPESRG